MRRVIRITPRRPGRRRLSCGKTSTATGRSAPRSRRPDIPLELELGELLRLRKPHPCGGFDWEVTRLGADIGLRCLKCGRHVLLERALLEKRIKQRLEAPNAAEVER